MAKLNYDASLGEMFENGSAPFTVKADPSKPPGDRFKDFVPQKEIVRVKASDEIRKKDFMRAPAHRVDADFVSHEDMAVQTKNDNVRIKQLAKQMYAAQSRKRQDYKKAKQLLESVSRNEQDYPKMEVERAKRIVSKKPPMNKESALREAAKQYYGHTT